MPLLEINQLSKRFGGLNAVEKVDLNVHQGEILGLIGPNGAGKSTILNMISGNLFPTRGELVFENEVITKLAVHNRVRRGIARIFQSNVLFANLTLIANVLMGLNIHTQLGLWKFLFGRYVYIADKSTHVDREKAVDLLRFVGLSLEMNKVASNLPHGKQRLLALSIALATEPKLLLLDEPVTGMNAEEVTEMLKIIRMLRDVKGITIILVEHNMKAVMGVCDRIATISYGKKIAEGKPEEISQNPAVIEAYLGAEQDVA